MEFDMSIWSPHSFSDFREVPLINFGCILWLIKFGWIRHENRWKIFILGYFPAKPSKFLLFPMRICDSDERRIGMTPPVSYYLTSYVHISCVCHMEYLCRTGNSITIYKWNCCWLIRWSWKWLTTRDAYAYWSSAFHSGCHNNLQDVISHIYLWLSVFFQRSF